MKSRGRIAIDVNGGERKIFARRGVSLLAALAKRGVFLPASCAGRGTCGSCACRVLSGAGRVLPAEMPYLDSDEVLSGLRLACRVEVEDDMRIILPGALLAVRRFASRVARIRDLTPDIKELTLALRGGRIGFRAGQYVRLVVPPHDRLPESVQRAYSLASAPEDSKRVRLFVGFVRRGIASTWVHAKLRPGDRVEFMGPFGEFGLRDGRAAAVCVAGGSGLAPFASIFFHMREAGARPDRDIWLFFGAAKTRDLFYLDELRNLAKQWPRFRLVVAVAELAPGEAWGDERGPVAEVLDRYLRSEIDASLPREGYLCGSPFLIDACVGVMKRNGVPEDAILFDKFV